MSTNNNQPQSPLEYPANDQVPVRIFRRNRAPLTTDYRNFKVRDFWNDTSSDDLWYLTSKTTASGVWIKLGGATAGDVQFLAGDSGGNIPPDGSGVVGVLGGTNITTFGSVNDVTYNLDDNIEVSSVSFDAGSNLLNYYETGTWTPVLRFGGETTGIEYSTQQGNYTRIGNIVFIGFIVSLQSKGSETGAATITGLPFTPSTLSEYSSACAFADINLGVGYTSVFAGVRGALGDILLARSGDNKIFDSVTDTEFQDDTILNQTIFYFV
jgi:hypothetical protein